MQTRFESPEPPPEPTDNAALSATVTCSYSSPWERCEAVNSGDDPASSNIPAANIGTRWGTWPQGGTHWVQYSWERPVRVDASDMYWFQDVPDSFNGGVKRPEQWSIEYWDGEGWVEVGNPSEYGLELNTYNRTTFDRVTTTRLRAVLQTRTTAGGTGALEWKVYSVEPSSVDAVHVTTPVGVPPELPETVTLRYDDGESLDAGVWWRPFDDDLLGRPGTFTVTGVMENNLVASAPALAVRRRTRRPEWAGPVAAQRR